MADIFKKLRNSFSTELSTDGDYWRILRQGTLVDLIKLSFFNFQKEGKEKYLIDIVNHSMKAKLLYHLKVIDLSGNMDEVYQKFNKEPEYIMNQYDSIFKELKTDFTKYSATNVYDLNEKVQYLKTINQLEIDSYADDIFDEIIGISYNILLDA